MFNMLLPSLLNISYVIYGFWGGPEGFFHHHDATALICSFSDLSPLIEINEPLEVMLTDLSHLTGGAHVKFMSLLTAFFTATRITLATLAWAF